MLPLAQSDLPPLPGWFYVAGCTLIGACIGSFLNVVIYRVPAGLSIVSPGSRCPKCEHPIRAIDNVPILSWILLKAKCRNCQAPISARYPAIELVTAVLFGTLAAVWLVPELYGQRVVDSDAFRAAPHVWAFARFLWRAFATSSLLCFVMMLWDRATIRWRFVLFVVLISGMTAFLWPVLVGHSVTVNKLNLNPSSAGPSDDDRSPELAGC